MDNLTLQQILLVNPFSTEPKVLAAIAQDPDLAQFAFELQQQHLALDDALQVPIPPMLSERLLRIPTANNAQLAKASTKIQRSWFVPLTMAASIALFATLGIQLYNNSTISNIGEHALAHVHKEEAKLLQQASTQSLADVNLKLASFDAHLDNWQDDIIYARYCTFEGIRSLHLAVKTATGYATIFVVPQQAELDFVAQFSDQQYLGLAMAMPKANIVIVSSNIDDLQQLPKKLNEKLIFSA